MSTHIYWVDNTQIYDCRTHSLIRPKNFDCVQVLDSLKEAGFEEQELVRKLKKIALLLMVLKREGIQQVLLAMLKKPATNNDFLEGQRYSVQIMTDKFKTNTLQNMDTDMVILILQVYLQDEWDKKIQLFKKILSPNQ